MPCRIGNHPLIRYPLLKPPHTLLLWDVYRSPNLAGSSMHLAPSLQPMTCVSLYAAGRNTTYKCPNL
jgi:hypothetical protein